MANQLTIHIKTEKVDDTTYQTVSTFAIEEKGQVSFVNKADKTANIEFASTSPFCQGNNGEPLSFDVLPGQVSPHKVCKDIADQEFKYTATVLDALPEDPILIIERAPYGGSNETNPIIWVEMLPWVGGAFIAGAAIAYFLMRRRTMGK
jgi:hypothetical protein